MERYDDRPDMMMAHNLVGHHAAVHDVKDIGLEAGNRPVDFIPQPVVGQRPLPAPVDEHNAHLEADRTQALDLFFDEDAAGGIRR